MPHCRRAWQIADAENGNTLIGELISLALIVVALLALLSGLSTTSKGVAIIEQRSNAENLARSQLELIKGAPYQPNPTLSPYPTIEPTGIYSLSVDIAYWVPEMGGETITGTFTTTVPADDAGLQWITVTVRSRQHSGGHIFRLAGFKANRP